MSAFGLWCSTTLALVMGTLGAGLAAPATAGTTILKGSTVCRSFEAAKRMQWANPAQTGALIRSGQCYVTHGNAPTLSAEAGPDIVEFRTADNPGVRKFTLVESVRQDRPAAPVSPPVATAGTETSDANALWTRGLNRFCPTRRLDWLNPGIMVEGIDAYLAGLPKETRAEIERRAKPDLNRCEMGADCPNMAYVRAAFAMSELAHMAQQVCRSTAYTCIAPYDCTAD
jgi:hypothetical protein